MKNLYGRLAVLKGSVRVPYGALTGPSRAPGDMHNNRRLPAGGPFKMNIGRAGPSRRHFERYSAVLNTGGADSRGHIQSESEKNVPLFKSCIV